MSEVRRISPKDGLSEDRITSVISGDSAKISSISFDEGEDGNLGHDQEGLIDDYAFRGQRVISGTFEFHQPHPFSGQDREYSAEFMFRKGSGLFLIAVENGSSMTKDAVRELNERLPEASRMKSGITSSTEAIWRFIQSAEDTGRIRVIQDGEIIDTEEIEEPPSEIKQYPVWDADLFFPRKDGEGEVEVVYNEESLSIDSDDLSEAEYAIQNFEQHIIAD